MKNIKELRESLLDNYEKMKNEEMQLKKGKELANTAGKVMMSLKLELEYNSTMDNKKKIAFLQYKD